MGIVYLARDPAIGRDVAVKLLSDQVNEDELRARFGREARAAGGLRHPNICTIFDTGEQDDQPFIVMEYMPGETLQALIRRKAGLTIPRKLEIMEEICAGLAHAHESGVVHRDVPSNLIVDQSGNVKILDFGIAKVGATAFTKPGAIVGTLNYMAPELFTEGVIDYRADIFAVGAVFYELLTGAPAFPGTLTEGVLRRISYQDPIALRDTCTDLDPEIDQVVARALAKRPEERFVNLSAMRTWLGKIRRRLEAADVTVSRPRSLNEAETVARTGSQAIGTDLNDAASLAFE